MRATITVIIEDDTSQEKLERAGITVGLMARMYRKGFKDILTPIVAEGATASVNVQVTDNTKEATP